MYPTLKMGWIPLIFVRLLRPYPFLPLLAWRFGLLLVFFCLWVRSYTISFFVYFTRVLILFDLFYHFLSNIVFFYSINEREWYCLYLSFALLRYLWFRFELICDWLRFCRVCLNHRHRSCGLVLIPATIVISDNSIIHIMDLSSLNNVECMEAILREYARHRYVLNSTRAESIAAVLSQLPASGPYSRDNVNLMFMVVGAEYSNDGHFLSRLRRILPDLASNWDDAGEMGWVSLVRAFG